MSRPIFLHLLLLIKKPATGSLTAPEALPINSTKEAWNGVIWKYKHSTLNMSYCSTVQWNSIEQLSRKNLGVLKSNVSSFTKRVCCCHRNSYWLSYWFPIAKKPKTQRQGTMWNGITEEKCKEGEIIDVFRMRKMSQTGDQSPCFRY